MVLKGDEKLRGLIRDHKEKIIIFLLAASLLFSFKVIRDKRIIENKYNEDYFKIYSELFIRGDVVNYLKSVDESILNDGADIEDIYILGNEYEEIFMKLIKLKDPYYEAYNGFKDMNVKKSYDFIDFFDHMGIYQYRVHSILDENRKKIPIGELVKGDINNTYPSKKINVAIRTIEEFNQEHKEEYKKLMDSNGKGFINKGYSLQLLDKLDKSIIDVQRKLDFGKDVPLGFRNIEKYRDVISWKQYNEISMHFSSNGISSGYHISDTSNGIVLYCRKQGFWDKFQIVEIKMEKNEVVIIIDEGAFKGDTRSGYTCMLNVIKGLKPGSTEDFEIILKNTKGEKYIRIEEK